MLFSVCVRNHIAERAAVQGAFRALRARTIYANTPIILGVESVASLSAGYMYSFVEKDPCIIPLRERPGGAHGTTKTNLITVSMTRTFQNLLATQTVRFAAAQDYIAVPKAPYRDAKYSEADAARDRQTRTTLSPQQHALVISAEMKALRAQLSVYEVEELPNGGITFSGKRGGKFDDLAISTIMLPFWKAAFLTSPRKEYAAVLGRILATAP